MYLTVTKCAGCQYQVSSAALLISCACTCACNTEECVHSLPVAHHKSGVLTHGTIHAAVFEANTAFTCSYHSSIPHTAHTTGCVFGCHLILHCYMLCTVRMYIVRVYIVHVHIKLYFPKLLRLLWIIISVCCIASGSSFFSVLFLFLFIVVHYARDCSCTVHVCVHQNVCMSHCMCVYCMWVYCTYMYVCVYFVYVHIEQYVHTSMYKHVRQCEGILFANATMYICVCVCMSRLGLHQ